jgi:hypothetical protein
MTDKYLTTQALEWFDDVKDGVWSWVFDEEQGYQRITAIASFILGALIVYIEPDVFFYAALAAGWLLVLAFLITCLIPIGYLAEWAVRKVKER